MAAGTLGPSVLPAVAEILRLVLPPRPLSRTQSWGEQESSWGGWTGLCWRLGLPVPPANDRSRNLEGTWETDAFSGTLLQTEQGAERGRQGCLKISQLIMGGSALLGTIPGVSQPWKGRPGWSLFLASLKTTGEVKLGR